MYVSIKDNIIYLQNVKDLFYVLVDIKEQFHTWVLYRYS